MSRKEFHQKWKRHQELLIQVPALPLWYLFCRKTALSKYQARPIDGDDAAARSLSRNTAADHSHENFMVMVNKLMILFSYRLCTILSPIGELFQILPTNPVSSIQFEGKCPLLLNSRMLQGRKENE